MLLEKEMNKIKKENKDYENNINELKEKNNKLLKDKEKYKSSIELFAKENKEASNHI